MKEGFKMAKLTAKELRIITDWLICHIFRNTKVMFAEDTETEEGEMYYDLIDIIATLHNLLCEAITGDKYDYMFHWCNKIGSDCNDKFFDEILKKKEG